MEELFEPINYDGSLHDYTVSDSGRDGRAAEAKALLFRSTSREEEAILALNNELSEFWKLWAKADSPEAMALLRERTTFDFFTESEGELVLRRNIYSGWCRYLGIFGVYCSPNFTHGEALRLLPKALALRFDFERFCRERLQTVPVRSEASLRGLIFTAFITLTIVARTQTLKASTRTRPLSVDPAAGHSVQPRTSPFRAAPRTFCGGRPELPIGYFAGNMAPALMSR